MSEPVRFHPDEHTDGAIADGLRRRGIAVTTTAGVALRGATDEEQPAFARAEQRVMVTDDDDNLRLHRRGVPHAGIAFCRPQPRSIGEVLRTLLLIRAVPSPEEMENHVELL